MGMPFLRQYATRFEREKVDGGAASMAFARLTSESSEALCWSCESSSNVTAKEDGTAQSQRPRASAALASGALLPEHRLPVEVLPPLAPRSAHRNASAVLKVESIRLPWWAVNPALRPAHVKGSVHAKGYNATAVREAEEGRFKWRLHL